jgi:hypothetical protein
MDSQKINEHQPVKAEFHQFPRLAPELRERIWWFALPAQRPLENYPDNDERKDSCVWAVGPFAMLRVCEQSRRIALSFTNLDLSSIHPETSQDGFSVLFQTLSQG